MQYSNNAEMSDKRQSTRLKKQKNNFLITAPRKDIDHVPCAGSIPSNPWLSESIRLNAPEGVCALHIVEGDATIGGTLCVKKLHVLEEQEGVVQRWQDFALELVSSPFYSLLSLEHARFKSLNGSIVISVEFHVSVSFKIDSVSISLPSSPLSSLTASPTRNSDVACIFDWNGDAAHNTEGQRGITVGRMEIRTGNDLITFYSPAFQPGTWRLAGTIEYEI